MCAVAIALSCFVACMAVQATSFVTVVTTVLEDKAISSLDVFTAALDHEPVSELANISRRDDDNSAGTPSMTRICIITPYTTCFEIPLTPHPNDKPKSQEPDDEDGWRDITDAPTPTPTIPSQVIETITRTQSAAGAPVRNTGVPTIHPSVAAATYTDIPPDWPPKVGPNTNPYMQPPLIPEIVNPGYVRTQPPYRFRD